MDKYASNVIDKVIKNCYKTEITVLLTHLESEESVPLSMLRDMVKSQFANFPLQKLLNEAINYRDENVKNALIKVLDRLSEAISPKGEEK